MAGTVLTPSRLVDRVAASIDQELGSAGWVRSVFAFDVFPTIEPATLLHCSYSVGLGRSLVQSQDGRQRRTRGLLVSTEVQVRFAVVLEALDQVLDYSEGLHHEVDLVQAVMVTESDPHLSLALLQIEPRQVLDQTVFLGEARFAAMHLYPIDPTASTRYPNP